MRSHFNNVLKRLRRVFYEGKIRNFEVKTASVSAFALFPLIFFTKVKEFGPVF
jgi:hypothetical protein